MTWTLPPLRRLIAAISSPPVTLSDRLAPNPGLLRTSNRARPASSEIVKRSGHHLVDIAYRTDCGPYLRAGRDLRMLAPAPDLSIGSARSLCDSSAGLSSG